MDNATLKNQDDHRHNFLLIESGTVNLCPYYILRCICGAEIGGISDNHPFPPYLPKPEKKVTES